MPKYGLWGWPNGERPGRIVSVIDKKAKKEGGANRAELNGFYQPDNAPGQIFVKVESKKEKEFSEIFSGVFLKGVLQQPGLVSYQSNFALPRAGMLVDEQAVISAGPSNIQVVNSEDTPQQIAIIQDRINAAPMIKNRRQLEEKRPLSQTKIQNKAEEFDQDQFAATLVMSALIADYSVHTGNFMQDKNTGEVVRIDFGSALRDILKPGNEKTIFSSPQGTKWYKDYIEDWTQDRERRGFIAAFIVDHEEEFRPENIDRLAEETCNELFSTVYANATSEDLHKIYAHLHGKDHESLSGYTEEQKVTLLKEKITQGMKTGMRARAVNLVKEGKALDTRTPSQKIQDTKTRIEKEENALKQHSRIKEALSISMAEYINNGDISWKDKPASTGRSIELTSFKNGREITTGYIHYADVANISDPRKKQEIEKTFETMEQNEQQAIECNNRIQLLQTRKGKYEHEKASLPRQPSILQRMATRVNLGNQPSRERAGTGTSHHLPVFDPAKDSSFHDPDVYNGVPQRPETAGTTPSGMSIPKPSQPMGANSAQLTTSQSISATVSQTHHQEHKPS
jgi:hypothetical protein